MRGHRLQRHRALFTAAMFAETQAMRESGQGDRCHAVGVTPLFLRGTKVEEWDAPINRRVISHASECRCALSRESDTFI